MGYMVWFITEMKYFTEKIIRVSYDSVCMGRRIFRGGFSYLPKTYCHTTLIQPV